MIGRRSISGAGAFVAAGVLVLAAVAYEGVDATRDLLREQRVMSADGVRTKYDCLSEGFRAALPEGSRVLLQTAARDDETYQRIVESTYPDYEFVARRADAAIVVRVVPGSECQPKITITGEIDRGSRP